MPCFYPREAWQGEDKKISFNERADSVRSFNLPCGVCIGCRMERSRQWAMRCLHESQMHEYNSFVTFTYSDENLPKDGSLNYTDFQLFMKKIRHHFDPTVIRFYMSGEYGGLTFRPHYHAILFGAFFTDRKPWKKSPSGHLLYASETLDKIWSHGDCYIGDVTFESAQYVASYINKKVVGKNAPEYYKRVSPDGEFYWLKPEFSNMSRKPGIGRTWYEKFKAEVYPLDRVVIKGTEVKPPRYYDLLAMVDARMYGDIEFNRMNKSEMAMVDSTEARLRVRENVLKARLNFYKEK